jgi:hypothetical protein
MSKSNLKLKSYAGVAIPRSSPADRFVEDVGVSGFAGCAFSVAGQFLSKAHNRPIHV